MKKKIKLLGILFLLSLVSLNAQTFYYYKGEKINLTVDRNYVYILADEHFIDSSFQKFNMEFANGKQVQDMVKLKFKSVPEMQEYSKTIELLKQNQQVKHVFPFFERGNADPIGTSDIFYVKLREAGDTMLLKMTAAEQNVQIVQQVPYMPLWYILSIQNSTLSSSVEATNYFYETGRFEDIDPAFMFNFKLNCTDDPMFGQQWGLSNPSYPGMDINVCEAWNITKGAGINVAVVDSKIDTTHNDLKANIHALSFDAEHVFKDVEPPDDDDVIVDNHAEHGTHVAGIIAAVKNNLQVVGVAPESKIMGVSVYMLLDNNSLRSTIAARLASGISWAWDEAGADIINNSWGDKGGLFYGYLHKPILEEAIINAIINGRNGKGCIVTFSGTGGDTMDYPARFYSDILTVGAICADGSRWNGSGVGSALDVMAPGENILSTIPGYSTRIKTGTSMACPHVSGIAALILSANPNLTGKQVRDIIEGTAKKVSTGDPYPYIYKTDSLHPYNTWYYQMGYGLVDAYAAVSLAASPCYNGEKIVQGGDSVSFSATWSEKIYVLNTITIPAGITLTITDTAKFAPEAAIIIKPGGKLIIDGGTLTNACDGQMWQGITVLGQSNQSQTPATNQGALEIKNNATIEHAVCAIKNYGLLPPYDYIDYTSTGGKISATDSRFVDNAQMVSLAPYYNTYYGSTTFSNCTFEILPTYSFNHPIKNKLIDIKGLERVYFKGCDFIYPYEEAQGTPEFQGSSPYGLSPWVTAISAFNSQLFVQGRSLCSTLLPRPSICNDYDSCTFHGFATAISASYSGGSASAITIDRTRFTKNYHGVEINAYPTAKLTNSDFGIGYEEDTLMINSLLGVHLSNTPIFDLYENNFRRMADEDDKITGISIFNSRTNNSSTYKNSFNNLNVGQEFIGYNRVPNGTANHAGLRYICNVNTDNENYDIYVSFFTGGQVLTQNELGVAYNQCSYDNRGNILSASNQFSQSVAWHIADYVGQEYFGSSQPNEMPDSVRITSYVSTEEIQSNSCPSKNGAIIWYDHVPLDGISISGDNLNPDDNNTLIPIYNYYNTNFNALQANYIQLIDGGNTEALIETVQGELSNDVSKIRQELKQKTPYLSQDVLKTVAKENLLPQALLLEESLANPDATKDYNFIEFLKYETPNPLPAYMIKMIEASWDKKTLRTYMEDELGCLTYNRDFFCNRMISNLVEDSTATPKELRTLLLSRGTLNDYFFAAETYLQENNFNGAFSTMYNYTQINPKLDKEIAIEIEHYYNYLSWLESLSKSKRNIYQLDKDDIEDLIDYVNKSIGRGRVLAHNILCGLYEICIEDMSEKSKKPNGTHGRRGESANGQKDEWVQVFPNPAKEYTSFIWNIETGANGRKHESTNGRKDESAKLQLSISDPTGKQLLTRKLDGAQGQWIWETATVPAGSYMYRVTHNGLQVGSGKIVITK